MGEERSDSLPPTIGLPRSSFAAGKAPENVGPYRLLRLLGKGGMGEVWEAEQEQPVQRRVALKLIKWGMDTREVVARFESERQALALMDHPGIAQVLDAGATDEGRPWFAMELVRGVRVTEFCDRQRLSLEERLALFVQICEAVQHAHHKGVIHRDLKPSNILVTSVDDRPQPKVIDFGVAKAVSQRLTERTVYTEIGRLIGTPEYMSPEQAELSPLDVDTRTDVYSLGALLYELLVGERLLDSAESGSTTLDEIRRRIREEEPGRPSLRVLGRAADDSREAAARRGTDPVSLARRLRGDLDWIVLKAVEKDRTRRYSSAADLAADVGRHLRDEPVLASPPGLRYRLGKFLRRHRVSVTAAALVLLALVVAVAGTGAGLVRALRAERRASAETETARAVSRFLVELFRVSEPSESRGNTVTAREILDRGAERIEGEFRERPLVRANLLETMGTVYKELGLYAEAEPLLSESVRAFEDEVEGERLARSRALQSLASLYQQQQRLAEAKSLLDVALALRQAELGDDHPEVADTLEELGTLYQRRGEYERALLPHERALAIRQHALPADDPVLARSLNSMSILYRQIGRYGDAEPLAVRALEIRERSLGRDHPAVATSLNNLAALRSARGRLDDAQALYERALEIKASAYGEAHPTYARGVINLAVIHSRKGEHVRAEEAYRRGLAIQERAFGPEHPQLATSLHNLALSLREQGKDVESIPILERTLALQQGSLGGGHPSVAATLHALGLAHRFGPQDVAAAGTYLRRALTIKERALGEHPDTAITLRALADLHADLGRDAEAEPLLARAVAIYEASLEPDHPDRVAVAAAYDDLRRRGGDESSDGNRPRRSE